MIFFSFLFVLLKHSGAEFPPYFQRHSLTPAPALLGAQIC